MARTLRKLLRHHGVLPPDHKGKGVRPVRINGTEASFGAKIRGECEVEIGEDRYAVTAIPGRDRFTIEPLKPLPRHRIAGKTRVYCGYHKCLTMYTRRVFESTFGSRWNFGPSFRHFFHRSDEFERYHEQYALSSISGHALDLDRYDDIRVVRFVRDPRDLVVSGYYYHLRGAEKWSRVPDPVESEWRIVDGVVPAALQPRESLASHLERVSLEDGLAAEFEFRRRHFDSMLAWPDSDPRVLLLRYEDTIGNEVETFRRIFDHFGFSWHLRRLGRRYADEYRASKRGGKDGHIRNASSGQWREHFTPALTERFDREYGDVLDKLGYPRDS